MSASHDRIHGGDAASHRSAFNAMDWIAMVLMIVGGLNWGLVGLLEFDLVAAMFGQLSVVSRAVYIVVGLAALYGIYMLVKMAKSRPG